MSDTNPHSTPKIRAVQKPTPELRKLARALLELARVKMEEEDGAAAEHGNEAEPGDAA